MKNGQCKCIFELAPCGVYCGACPSFGKTCLGCPSEDRNQNRTSKWSCKIRICCYQEQGIDFCYQCQEFPCSEQRRKLLDSHPGDPRFQYRHEIRKNFQKLKKVGLEQYLKYQAERHTCPDCGGRIHFYHYQCAQCGKETQVQT